MEAPWGHQSWGPVRADPERMQAARPSPRTHDSDQRLWLPSWKLWVMESPPPPNQQMQKSFSLLIRPTPGHSRGHFIRTLQESVMSPRDCLRHETKRLGPSSMAAPMPPSLGPLQRRVHCGHCFGTTTGSGCPRMSLSAPCPGHQDTALWNLAYSEAQWAPIGKLTIFTTLSAPSVPSGLHLSPGWPQKASNCSPCFHPDPHGLVYTAARAILSGTSPIPPLLYAPRGPAFHASQWACTRSTLLLPIFISYPLPFTLL